MTSLRYLLIVVVALLVFGAMAQQATETAKSVRCLIFRKGTPHQRPFKSPQQRPLPLPISPMKCLPLLPLLLLPPLPHQPLSRKLKFPPQLPRPIWKRSKSSICLNKNSRGSCQEHHSRSQIPRVSTHLSI
jgi:hypothetical protein